MTVLIHVCESTVMHQTCTHYEKNDRLRVIFPSTYFSLVSLNRNKIIIRLFSKSLSLISCEIDQGWKKAELYSDTAASGSFVEEIKTAHLPPLLIVRKHERQLRTGPLNASPAVKHMIVPHVCWSSHSSEPMNYAQFVRQRFVTGKKGPEKRGNSSVNSDRNKVRARESARRSIFHTTRARPDLHVRPHARPPASG